MRKSRTSYKLNWAAGKPAALFLAVTFWCSEFLIAHAQDQWLAGRFSFSDELGGFEITDVSGTGTRHDPFVIKQVFDTSTSVTLTIRMHQLEGTARLPVNNATHSSFHIQIETLNNSNLPWIGLGFELQEHPRKASTYGDGLSFDQLSRRKENVSSNRFEHFEFQFEPGDRLIFTGGDVNSNTRVTTRFVITDFTPVDKFYLFQDPLIPAS